MRKCGAELSTGYNECEAHLERIWSAPEAHLKRTGNVFRTHSERIQSQVDLYHEPGKEYCIHYPGDKANK